MNAIVRVQMSAEALGITPDERDALMWVRDELSGGNIVHDLLDQDEVMPRGFNMNQVLAEWDEQDNCGTTGCIGGWMYHRMRELSGQVPGNMTARQWVASGASNALRPLFFPLTNRNGSVMVDRDGREFDFPYDHIEESAALEAIDNFLTTGWPDYEAVLEVSYA